MKRLASHCAHVGRHGSKSLPLGQVLLKGGAGGFCGSWVPMVNRGPWRVLVPMQAAGF